MKVVLSLDEVKAVIAEYVWGRVLEDEKPTEVVFVHRFSDGSGDSDVNNIATIHHIEVKFDKAKPPIEGDCGVKDPHVLCRQPFCKSCKNKKRPK